MILEKLISMICEEFGFSEDEVDGSAPLYEFINDDAELEEGLYFIQDIIGLTVKDADSGEVYGKITDVYQNGASDVYSIRKDDGRELMFPCIDEVVISIDVEGGEMLIRPLAGLFEGAENGDED